ncbi:hypothetical protein B0A55_02611 [Friedmanniomyces simplex]|uniref:Uncharacterized protein n=1 Tax=Friedmanniomyces simplex TaxID=329884 RepID=A0A4V6WL66_9PEZI|nr:hypothetical protein B0A55_02611 [Friedmanniomyces simplex]
MASPDYTYNHFNITFPSQHVAQVEINRPQKLNAFIEQMWIDLGAIFRKLSIDPDVRAVILTAVGDRAFTSGLDVQAASENGAVARTEHADPARKATAIRRHILDFQEDISAIEKCEKPVIAVLHGISYGLAIDMTTCCDIRICSRDTRFSVREVDIGLAADIGTLTRLPKANVPMSWVKEVCLTARDFGAEEALRVGFVSAVYESKGAALGKAVEMGRLLASKSPVAVQSTKQILNYSRDHSVADGLNQIAVLNSPITEDGQRPRPYGVDSRAQANGRKLVPNGVSIMSKFDIVIAMSEHVYLVTKPIQAGQTHIDLFKADLLDPTEQYGNPRSAKFGGKEVTPWRAFLGHEWEGHSSEELTIPTPKAKKIITDSAKCTESPDSSCANTSEGEAK